MEARFVRGDVRRNLVTGVVFEMRFGKELRHLQRGLHIPERGGEDELIACGGELADDTLGVRGRGHVLDESGFHLGAEGLLDFLASQIVLVRPAGVAHRIDVDERHFQRLVRGEGSLSSRRMTAPRPARTSVSSIPRIAGLQLFIMHDSCPVRQPCASGVPLQPRVPSWRLSFRSSSVAAASTSSTESFIATARRHAASASSWPLHLGIEIAHGLMFAEFARSRMHRFRSRKPPRRKQRAASSGALLQLVLRRAPPLRDSDLTVFQRDRGRIEGRSRAWRSMWAARRCRPSRNPHGPRASSRYRCSKLDGIWNGMSHVSVGRPAAETAEIEIRRRESRVCHTAARCRDSLRPHRQR